jgi:hypothetical protein
MTPAPLAMALADFDADGLLDLATVSTYPSEVTVRLGTGSGTFAAPQHVANSASSGRALEAGDLDADGVLDLVAVNGNSNSLSVWLGDGLGGFGPVATFGTGPAPVDLVLADVDADGDLDAAVACPGSDDVALMLGDGHGAFSIGSWHPVGTDPQGVLVADFNADGRMDLATANYDSQDVTVLLRTAAGGYVSSAPYPVGGNSRSLVAADVDGDGTVDIAAIGTSATSDAVAVLLGIGNGSFAPSMHFRTAPGPYTLSSGDLDFDGKPDLVTTNSPSSATVLLNTARSGPFSYCTAGITSNGCTPRIASTGTPSLSAVSGFVVSVSEVEGMRNGVIFVGIHGSLGLPWATGSTSYLCVRQPLQRLTPMSSGGTSGACDGSFAVDLNNVFWLNPYITGTFLQPGTTVQTQAWFRDPPAPRTSNLSAGLEFTLQP